MRTRWIQDDIKTAAALLREGELVAVPTETVYGLAGNGLDERAVQAIYEVKGRPAVKPLSLMVPGAEAMRLYCEDIPPQAYSLAARFWPGPLTLVMKARPAVPEIVRAGGETVGLRCPDHPLTLALLREAGVPFAAPSANPSGAESPKTAQAVRDYFDGRIAAVVDGGPCGLGRESTLLDLSRTPYRVLRRGALGEEEIAAALADGMTVIGLTGPSGAGKTTALREIEALGGLVLDCDAVYHELLETDGALLRELDAAFPGAVSGGRLDRKALGAQVFSDPAALGRLNALTHRFVSAEVERRLHAWAMAGGRLAAVDAIALVESGLAARCTATVAVLAPRETRIERIMARDGIDRQAAERRVDAQRDDAFFTQHCTYTAVNDGDSAAFARSFRTILGTINKGDIS